MRLYYSNVLKAKEDDWLNHAKINKVVDRMTVQAHLYLIYLNCFIAEDDA